MAEQYREKFLTMLHYSNQVFALALARDVGIMEALLKATRPLSCKEIADEKELKERYVQEILGSLTSSQIVELQTNANGITEYFFSEAGKEALSSGGTYERTLMFNAIMASYKAVRECVYRDGPCTARYEDDLFYARDEMTQQTVDNTVGLFLSKAPGLEQRLEQGISVAEIGSGTGRVLAKLAQKFPNSKFTATDIRPHLVERMKSLYSHLHNIHYREIDICTFPESIDEQYDFIFTIDVIHDLPYPQKALKVLRRYLRGPDGTLIFIDMAGPGSHEANVGDRQAAAMYATSTFMCIPESFQQSDGVALGACSSRDALAKLATDADFNVDTIILEKHVALFLCKLALN
ncbi:uncharacterized protein LOC101853577 [Aplysia californica]|uniref:Uncharacterized protein LOC101853577 n=1 Tax=Aplysia californica TaxID=6500 RepID=A0ABM0K167_APLCA|nr:uncharacterized protein LOC101853577 [Aplysia californica]